MPRMQIEDRTFANEDIEADGKEFIKCEFTKCIFVYSGGVVPNFHRCKFSDDCHFDFADCAGNTLNLLTQLCGDSFFGPTTRAILAELIRESVHQPGSSKH